MSKSVDSSLGEVAGELDRAADTSDDQAVSDACRILAAKARGERPPADAARRVVQRAQGESQ